MAKRFTDTDIWDKEWFMALPCKGKCLIRFLYDKCDVAGVWSANWILASAYIGEQVSETDLSMFGDRIEKLADGKFFIVDFIDFQYGTLSENCKPHIKIINLLKKYELYERVCKGYPKGMYTLEEKEEEKEEDKDKEKDGTEGDVGGDKPGESSTSKSKKNKYAEYVSLTADEYQKLLDEHGEDNALELISILNAYKGSNGKKYKSDYLAILNWVVERLYEKQGNNGSKWQKGGTNGGVGSTNNSGTPRNPEANQAAGGSRNPDSSKDYTERF